MIVWELCDTTGVSGPSVQADGWTGCLGAEGVWSAAIQCLLSDENPLLSATSTDKMYQSLKQNSIWGLDANSAKQIQAANNTEIFANGDSGLAGTDVALGGPRPVQAGFF